MSDYIVRLIPEDPYCRIDERDLQSAKEMLTDKIVCDRISISSFEHTSFIDCGGNLRRITCPNCGSEVDFARWGDQMSKAHADSFISLDICMPCCNKEVSLNDLIYDFPCGFACSVLEILNPKEEITEELKAQIEKISGTPVKTINAHI